MSSQLAREKWYEQRSRKALTLRESPAELIAMLVDTTNMPKYKAKRQMKRKQVCNRKGEKSKRRVQFVNKHKKNEMQLLAQHSTPFKLPLVKTLLGHRLH